MAANKKAISESKSEVLETKKSNVSETKPKFKILTTISSGRHRIAGTCYTFKKGEKLKVPKEHYDKMKKLTHIYN